MSCNHGEIDKEDCEHELEHCKHCDTIYCKKCKKEWGVQPVILPYISPIQPIYPRTPWVEPYITWTSGSTSTICCKDAGKVKC